MRMLKVRKYLFDKENYLLVFALTFFVIAGVINLKNEMPLIELSKQDTAININSNVLKFINAGNKRLITDLLWVQTLIESDIERYKGRDLNNWLFLRFNTISTLDPRFYENYFYGGQFLAIIMDDLEGADIIYAKGIKEFPEDYKLNFNAGFLNYYEMGNYQKGLTYLRKVEAHPSAPPFIKSIINKLLLATGVSLEEVFNLVKHNFETTNDLSLKSKLRGDLYALRAEIDLSCLKERRLDCNLKDLDGNPYLRKDGKYYSSKIFLRYKIKKREGDASPSQSKPINTI